ncbi:transcriptional regulator [Frankia sp. CgS1]|uniref:Transcriptional regulator, XRE family n=3 Tax=Frankiaceae TaxID=74712 RepID=Q2J9B4_FRACC|nr:transcriptional regulator, XRE family [Frankia casuarinae]OHV51704.1 transcriptional regulator [Frankia sp. CgIS1]
MLSRPPDVPDVPDVPDRRCRPGRPIRLEPMSDDARQRELGFFLRAHRERLRPEDVGLPATPRRRTPGLRREEVAALSGLGLAWYTWLEQGRVAASRQVLEAVARALRLDDDGRRHALALAGLHTPPADRHHTLVKALRSVLDNWPNCPALLLDRRFDVTAWNDAYTVLWGDPADVPEPQRNLLWLLVAQPRTRDGMGGSEDVAKDLLAQFRAQIGHHPDDQRGRAVLELLEQARPELRAWWQCRSVRVFTGRTVSAATPLGDISLMLSVLRPGDDPESTIWLQTPATPADRELLTRLAAETPGAAGRPDPAARQRLSA